MPMKDKPELYLLDVDALLEVLKSGTVYCLKPLTPPRAIWVRRSEILDIQPETLDLKQRNAA